mgnify:CR=1 FL=1
MPRPIAFRKTMREAIINALLAGNTDRDACEAAGIPWSTWRDWSRQHREGGHPDPDVDALIAEARVAYAKASTAITAQVRIAGAKDWRASAFLLQHRQGDPKARHDTRRARYEAEVAKNRAAGTHVERHEIAHATDDALLEEALALAAALRGSDPSAPH